MSKKYVINVTVGDCQGRAEVTKIPKSHIPLLEEGYQIVITVPFITKATAQKVCDRFIKYGLQSPPLRDDESKSKEDDNENLP